MPKSSTSFRPGQSGNKAGRPAEHTLPDGRTLRELAKEHTVEAIETLVGIAKDTAAPASARVAAASAVLDRGHGKPAITVGDDNGDTVDWVAILVRARDRAMEGQRLRHVSDAE